MKSKLIKPQGLLPSTLSKYFRHAIGFSSRLTPAPTNQEDLNYIYDELNKLAPIDIFKTTDKKNSGFYIDIIFNPGRDASWYGMIGDPNRSSSPSFERSQLSLNHDYPGKSNILHDLSSPLEMNEEYSKKFNQRLIDDKLSKIIAIPRYEYIKNIEDFKNDNLQIPFKHNLVTPKFRKRYSLNSAIGSDPIVYVNINPGEEDVVDIPTLRYEMRYNFTRFYKFDRVQILNNQSYRLLHKDIFNRS